MVAGSMEDLCLGAILNEQSVVDMHTARVMFVEQNLCMLCL
jgi:hypothetical protein